MGTKAIAASLDKVASSLGGFFPGMGEDTKYVDLDKLLNDAEGPLLLESEFDATDAV